MKTKYYSKIKKDLLFERFIKEFEANYNNDIIICYQQDKILGFLEYNFELNLITNLNYYKNEVLKLLINKLMILTRQNNEFIYINNDIYLMYKEDLTYFSFDKDRTFYKAKNKLLNPTRFIKFGKLPAGLNNSITDVNGVLVGHSSINEGNIHTGVTAILPHQGNIFKNKVIASSYAFNGYGKSMGLIQVEELGTIETPILLTNTLNIGKVSDGLISYLLKENEDIGTTTGTVNPLVFECNDSHLNDIRARVLDEKNVFEAIENASTSFVQGNVGAGSGMRCHGFKSGIGTSSRVININSVPYTLGVLVNSNFNVNTSEHLILNNRPLGEYINNLNESNKDQGSIIIVIATDIPLESRQLKRICKRASLGIGKTGGYAGNGSGDIFIAFSTANIINHYPNNPIINITTLSDDYIDEVFQATVEATEEAIINSLLHSKETKGINNHISKSINDYQELFDDLYIENH